jgi:hypothetical protein
MIKFNYVFDRKKKCDSGAKKGVIELRVYENKTHYITTKFFIIPKEWDKITHIRVWKLFIDSWKVVAVSGVPLSGK